MINRYICQRKFSLNWRYFKVIIHTNVVNDDRDDGNDIHGDEHAFLFVSVNIIHGISLHLQYVTNRKTNVSNRKYSTNSWHISKNTAPLFSI